MDVVVPLPPPPFRRSEGLAQQVLTAAAKARCQKDPALALACSGALLALAAEDALPAYLSSSAAAVLASQLLQVRVCVSGTAPCLHQSSAEPAAAGARASRS